MSIAKKRNRSNDLIWNVNVIEMSIYLFSICQLGERKKLNPTWRLTWVLKQNKLWRLKKLHKQMQIVSF